MCACKHVHQFGDFLALILDIAAGNRVLDAVTDVIVQDVFFDAPERRTDSGDLGHDINAVSIFVDHTRKPAHLTLDSHQSLEARRFCVLLHA